MKQIKNMSNRELLKEWKKMDELINVSGCFGINDLIYERELAREMDRREE